MNTQVHVAETTVHVFKMAFGNGKPFGGLTVRIENIFSGSKARMVCRIESVPFERSDSPGNNDAI